MLLSCSRVLGNEKCGEDIRILVMTYTKMGDPIKLPGKNNDYIVGGRIKKGSPTNLYYAKADEREGDLEYEIFCE